MPSTYSTTLRLELPSNGEQSGIWGQTLNKDLNLIEQSIAGITDIYLTGDTYTLSSFNGLEDEARSAVISCTGILSAPANVVAPSVQKTYIVTNTAGANVTIKTSTGNGVIVLNNTSSLVYCDGTNFYTAVSLNSVTGNQTISGNEAIGANVTAGGNLTVTSNVTSFNGNLTFTSNTSIVTAGTNTGAYTPPTGTTAQRPSSPIGGMSRFNTDIGAYEIFNGAVWQPITGAYAVSYLLVAGGGGGSGVGSGGGGAGGFLANVTSVQPGTSYPITVGAGGNGSVVGAGTNGANSSAFSLTAIGGGRGGESNAGSAGGSGGGGGSFNGGAGGAGTSGQGNAGGAGNGGNNNFGGGGGGGAGQVGVNGTGSGGGNGGNGLQSAINGTNTYYAGGGGGANDVGLTPSQGGAGGGAPQGGSQNAVANTGGGGAGYNGYGGSGVVIVSYPSASQRATGGTVTTYTSSGTVYWVHTFTSSGTFVA
jgi:hypothetical protein